MNVLLINTNPVVSRLISLCMRDQDTVFEEVPDVSAVVLDRYDIAFVDDASHSAGLRDVLLNIMIRKKVFLSSKSFSEDDLDYFDEVIKKPFLPSQITAILESLDELENDTEESVEDHFIFPLSAGEDNIEDAVEEEELEEKTEVLDSSEIERIKVLLEDDDLEVKPVEIEDNSDYETRKVEAITQHLKADGLEIVSEEEYVETLSTKPKKKKKEKTFTFEEALIAAVEGMKVKKIKKLLKGAEVSIKINFKDKK